ncbi:MAG: helix-turn-helix domain-containing protein [Deltaproteobacteria bacterium]|nr:helix-turn-helix domain-containing protein [Deltaproteobacteria bacterium]MBW2137859.1 helix-turn-helix domain-containing protein [Deltaproteobacteria bacterium]
MVKSAERVLQILEAVRSSGGGKTHRELASSLKIPKNSLSLLLSNLSDREYLFLNSKNRRYVLGPQVLALASEHLSGLDIVRLGQPIVKKITRAIDESAEIPIKTGEEIMVISKEDRAKPLARMIQIGECAPMYATAGGKAILAHLPEEEVDRYSSSVQLRPITKATITDKKQPWAELRSIWSGSVARSNEELCEGVTAVATTKCPRNTSALQNPNRTLLTFHSDAASSGIKIRHARGGTAFF